MYLTPSTSTSQSVSHSQHNRAFWRQMGKFFFAILCQVPSNGNIWIKASNISWFLGFLFSALPCFLSHLVFKFCIIAHGSNQEEKIAEVCEV